MKRKYPKFSLQYWQFTCALSCAILDISIIENCLCFDHCYILVYVVTFTDYGFCPCLYLAKLLAEGHSFDCIRPMVEFHILRSWSHRKQC